MARRSTRRFGTRVADVHQAAPGDGDDGSPAEHRDGHTADTSDPAALARRNLVATGHLADGRLRAAVIALESLLYDCRIVLGVEHPETLVVEGNLAVAHVQAGQHEAGIEVMSANLAGRERVFGDVHPLTLAARDALATTHRLAGRFPEAMWLYSRVAPQRNEVLGPLHPGALTTRRGLGLTFAEAGDTGMARDVFTAALEDCGHAGVEHVAILRACLAELRDADPAPEADPAPDHPAAGGTTVPRQRRDSGPAIPASLPPRHGGGRGLPVDVGPVETAMT